MDIRRPGALAAAAATPLLLLLGACGGGGGGGGDGDAAESLAAKTSFTDEDVRHLLVRTHFGVVESERLAVHAAGVPAYVSSMLAFPPGSTVEDEANALLVNADDPPGLEGQFPSHAQVAQRWLHLMTRTTTPFQERLAFFWHDHFAASSSIVESNATWWVREHVDLWRREGAGNLRDLLVRMARDPLMLAWLNGLESTRRAPNENFAREFFELFTLGVDQGYTQQDIVEAARAFTGWRQRFDATTGRAYVEFDPNRHDAGAKTIFGVAIPGQNLTDDYEAVVDLTLENRPVAEFVARKLFEHFVYEDPSDALVSRLAAILRDAEWELAPLLRAIFLSEAFYSARAKAGIVKGPVDHAVGFIRSTGLRIRLSSLDTALSAGGQRPTMPPTVNGWPEGSLLLSAQGMLDRANLVLQCVTDRTRQAEAGIDPRGLLPPGAPTSLESVRALASLLRVSLSPEDETRCAGYLDSQRRNDGTTVASPFDASNATHVDERVRGLLYVLAQHPTYQIR